MIAAARSRPASRKPVCRARVIDSAIPSETRTSAPLDAFASGAWHFKSPVMTTERPL
jgi:hypothetical protein